MRKFLIALVAAATMVIGLAPMAQAAGDTNPVALPETIYPYVVGGEGVHANDSSTVTWDVDEDAGFLYITRGGTVYRTATFDEFTNSYVWNGRDNGGFLVPASEGGLAYTVNVVQGALPADVDEPADGINDELLALPTTPGNQTTVNVVHVDHYITLTSVVDGNSYRTAKINGDCQVRRQSKAALVKCKDDSAAVLRYRLSPPPLNSEQNFTGSEATCSFVGPVFRNGGGTNVNTTDLGARIVALDKFWGKINEVHKKFQVHEVF